jgi:hypothetical protein
LLINDSRLTEVFINRFSIIMSFLTREHNHVDVRNKVINLMSLIFWVDIFLDKFELLN